MAECEWVHLCDYAFFDVNNKPCLVGIFEAVAAPRVPATHTRCCLALRIKGGAGQASRLDIELVRHEAPDPLFATTTEINIGPGGAHHMMIGFDNILLPDFGFYEFRVRVDGGPPTIVGFNLNRKDAQP